MAERVDLHLQADLQPLLAQLDQPVEAGLPVAVSRQVVVGEEEPADADGVVGAHDRFQVVGAAEARHAALHVDDGAEGALERAAAAEVEARIGAMGPLHLGGFEEGDRGSRRRRTAREGAAEREVRAVGDARGIRRDRGAARR